MKVFPTPQAASNWRQQLPKDCTVGLVPTMGALHEGHAELARRSVEKVDITIASIFVNPLQFNEQRDYDSYPNTFETDCALLERLGVDAVFSGTLDDFFAGEAPQLEKVGAEGLSLEGSFRPGHFEGVRAIVKALFEWTRPDFSFFGQKDLQQALIIRALAKEMGYPKITIVPTVREANGLALSSRNVRLSNSGIETASHLFKSLLRAKAAFQQGERRSKTLEASMAAYLKEQSIEFEYAAVRNAASWSESSPQILDGEAYALTAAWIEGVRLIDNIALHDTPNH